MELYEMIYSRLREDSAIESLTATYNDGAAVFYQTAATADNDRWGSSIQYPRIDYMLDMMENPARNTSGVLTVNVWCDSQIGAEPETIDKRIIALLHTAFAQTDDYAYVFSWVRSDAFEAKSAENAARTIGITLSFDVTACPCQETMYPDPIKGLNTWTKGILPNAVVIGYDAFTGWIEPSKSHPIVYWRLTSEAKDVQHYTHTWMSITAECHVYCNSAADRQYNLIQLNRAHALADHITLEDTSPLFLKTFSVQPHLNYINTGQIRAAGTFGILQPESHFSRMATGGKINNPILEE